jgi:hypothetical protein
MMAKFWISGGYPVMILMFWGFFLLDRSSTQKVSIIKHERQDPPENEERTGEKSRIDPQGKPHTKGRRRL